MASVETEREGCALLADKLATKWEATAARWRAEGTRKPWFGKPYVLPIAERDAKAIDAAASGLRTVAKLIRDGYAQKAFENAQP